MVTLRLEEQAQFVDAGGATKHSVDGRTITFDRLAPGSYEIRHDKKKVTVRVPGPAEVVVR